MPVLITAGLSPEAYRLQRILNAKDVVFADASQLPQIPGTRSVVLPAADSPSFVHEALKACLDLDITTVYPLKRAEVVELAKARELFFEYNISLMIPSDNWLQDTNSPKTGKAEQVSVLENGSLIAGDSLPEDSSITDETGVFCWASHGQRTEYSLYLV